VAMSKMELLSLVRKAEAGDVDFLGEGVRVLAQALMDAEVSEQIGAEHSQRTPDRATHRNGYRARDWDTRVGTIDLQIPRVRESSYLPSFLEPRRRAERALAAVVAQCHVEGVSTRRVEDIAQRWDHQPVQVAGLAGLWRAGRAGRRLAQPAPGRGPVRVGVAGRAGDQGP
jgi:transposase-like protein